MSRIILLVISTIVVLIVSILAFVAKPERWTTGAGAPMATLERSPDSGQVPPLTAPPATHQKGQLDPLRIEVDDISNVLSRARSGAALDQVQIYTTLSHCHGVRDIYGESVAAQEAYLTDFYHALGPIQYQALQNSFRTCNRINEVTTAREKDAGKWLQAALAQDYPPAWAYHGIELGLNGNIAEAESSLRKALFSQDPQAVLIAGPALTSAMHGQSGGGYVTELAWLLVACELGLDCDGDSAIKLMYCDTGCTQTETAAEAFSRQRHLLQNEIHMANVYAAQYSARLRSGDQTQFNLIAD